MVASVYKWLKFVLCPLVLVAGSGFRVSEDAKPIVHPVYVSVIEMDYNPTDKTLEISCKMFSDDTEKALAKANNASVDIHNPKDKTLLEKQLADYIRKHFQVKVDGKFLPLEYVGYEIESQSTLSYFQISNVGSAPKKIDIATNILHELYNSQINIIHVNIGGNRKSTKLDYPATAVNLEW